jgi:hypothetical protein
MLFASADTGAHHAVVEAFRHSGIAPYAGSAACFIGVLVLMGSLVSYFDPNGDIAASDDVSSPRGSKSRTAADPPRGGQRSVDVRQDSGGAGHRRASACA